MKIFCWISFSIMCALSSKGLMANENNLMESTNGKFNLSFEKVKILNAINHLDKACLLSQSIEDRNIRDSVSNQLKACSRCLRREFLSKNYANVLEAATVLYENIEEILADCQNFEIRHKITSYVIEMMDNLENTDSNITFQKVM